MKFSKKLLSMMLVISMMVTVILPVSAQDFKQPDVVNIFDTIYGYQRDRVKQTVGVLPELPAGLRAADGLHYKANGLTSETAEDGSSYIRVSNETVGGYANVEWIFDEVIKKGNLTVSFDMYYPWDASKATTGFPYVYMDLIDGSVNDNPTDKLTAEGGYPGHLELFSINKADSDGVIMVSEEDTISIADSIANKWSKLTVSFNAETGETKVYINGTLAGTKNRSNKGVKMLNMNINSRDTNVIGEVLFDNFYVRHSQSELAEITTGADYENGGVAAENGVVRMGVAETLKVFTEEFELDPSDFVVKNADGEKVNAIKKVEKANGRKNELVFTVSGLNKGSYTLGVDKTGEYAEYYEGVLSGKLPQDISFAVKGDVQSKKDARRYYVDEDFENYNGGYPDGALEKTLYGMNNANNMVAVTDNAGGKSLSFKTADRTIWQFDKPFMGGKLFVEFDVKPNGTENSDGRWHLSLLKARDFLAENYVPADYWEVYKPGGNGSNAVKIPSQHQDGEQYSCYMTQLNAAKAAAGDTFDENTWRSTTWLNEWKAYRAADTTAAKNSRYSSRQQSIARSVTIGTSNGATKLSYAKARKEYGSYAGTAVDSSFPELTRGEWNHIKLEIDTEAAQYILTVGGKTVKLDYDVANYMAGGQSASEHGVPAYANSYDINTGKLRVDPGFGGISFDAVNPATSGLQNFVEFDNIRVYTEDSYNSYSEFNNAARGQTVAAAEASTPITGVNMPDWLSPDQPSIIHYQRKDNAITLTSGAGRNSATNNADKSLMVNLGKTGAGTLVHPFNVPVKAGREFNIEFDYKSEQDQAFALGLLEAGNLMQYQLSDWHRVDNSLMAGMIETTKGGSATSLNNPTARNILSNWTADDTTANKAGDMFRFLKGNSVDDYDTTNNPRYATGVKYEQGKWHHIKLNAKPVDGKLQIQATVTYEDGTSQSSQPYMTEIVSTNDIAALILKFSYHATKSPLTVVNNRQHLFDNLAVYEVETVSNAYLTEVKAKTADGKTEVVTDTIKETTTELELSFTHKLADANGISVVNADNTALDADVTLAENKMSALVKLNETLEAGEELIVKVSGNQAIESESYMEKMDKASVTLDVVAANLPVGISEMRIYKWYEGRTYTSGSNETISSEEGYYPLTASALADVTAEEDYKLVIKGHNYSGTQPTIWLIKAIYNGGKLEDTVAVPKTLTNGVFDLSEKVTFDNGATGTVKYFVWDSNGILPLVENLDYEMTVSE